jgi:Flp pilus assembly protein TadB
MTQAEYALKGHISMFSPFLSGKQNRSDEEVAGRERQQAKLGKDYESPWLSGLVTFSGFVAAFIGSVAALFVIANLRHGTVWLPYALILAALVGVHLCLRAVRYRRRRHARQPAVGDHGRPMRDRTANRSTER